MERSFQEEYREIDVKLKNFAYMNAVSINPQLSAFISFKYYLNI